MAGEHLDEKNGVQFGCLSYRSDGAVVDGYLARPSDGQPHPGIVLIQEWWGLEAHIKDMAERLAREGYVVLAPDLYHGKVVAEPDEAEKALMALNMPIAVTEIRAGIDYLQSRDDVQPKKPGVVGFCMGGHLAWRVAEQENGDIGALVPFYGAGYQPSDQDIGKVTAPVLAIYGTRDESIPTAQRERIVNQLQAQNKTHKALLYDAGHAFMNDQHDSHDPASATQAYGEMVRWLKQYLG